MGHAAWMPISRRTALLACLALAVPAAVAGAAPPPLPPGSPGPLGHWRVEAIGPAPLPATPRADITFTAEGRAHGSSGCNRFTGGFALDGAALRFEPVAGTRMACEAPAMALEQRFLDALAAVRGWRKDGAALLLTDNTGTTVIRLLPAEAG